MADKTIKKNTIETLEDLELAMQELREAQKNLHTGAGRCNFQGCGNSGKQGSYSIIQDGSC